MMAQLARFGLVGVTAMAVHWIVVWLLVPLGIAPLLANLIGFATAFNVSYLGHRNWTFASDRAHGTTFWRFLTVALSSFAINEALYFVLLKFLDYRIALIIVLVAVAALTFVASKLWAFRSPAVSSATDRTPRVE
jgi:putative flippase GtrA